MKQRYEERIAELEEERNVAEQEQERVELELNRALDAGRRLQAQLAQTGAPAAASPRDLQTEVPSWMLTAFNHNSDITYTVCSPDFCSKFLLRITVLSYARVFTHLST